MRLDELRLFHITAIDNLPGIFEQGALLCKKEGVRRGVQYHNIAHFGAQGVRAGRGVPDPPGGTIHDYVPPLFCAPLPHAYGDSLR